MNEYTCVCGGGVDKRVAKTLDLFPVLDDK